jgi:hypothetical protein
MKISKNIIFVLILLAAIGSFYLSKPTIEDAKKLGFSSVKEMSIAQDLGYATRKEFDNRYKDYGFDSLEEMYAVNNQGYKTKSDFENRYKDYGFNSIREMNKLKGQGYDTKGNYLKAKNNSVEWFVKKCKDTYAQYDKNCFGNKIIWKGVVMSRNLGGISSINISVRNDDGSHPSRPFNIDSKSLLDYRDLFKTGDMIGFHGSVDEENFTTPDIERITFVDVESNKDKEIRLANEKKIEDERLKKQQEKQEQLRKKKVDSIKKHGNNAKWMKDNFHVDAEIKCHKKIPMLAKYGHKWVDGFLDSRFPYYERSVKEDGVLTIVGDKIKFQNIFGAWIPYKYYCDYDVINDIVLDYGLYE